MTHVTSITVENNYLPVWQDPLANGRGKFYAAMICRVITSAGGIYLVPVWNWGAGSYRSHTTGQIGLGRMHSDFHLADIEASNQLSRKVRAGYAIQSGTPCPATGTRPPGSVTAKIEAVVIASSAVSNTATPVPMGTSGPKFSGGIAASKAPRPGSPGAAVVTFVDAFEAAATDVLTAGDLEGAIDRLTKLKGDFTKFSEQYERAESALEMANMQVRSRLTR